MKRQIKIKLYCDIELFKISLAIQMKEKYSLIKKNYVYDKDYYKTEKELNTIELIEKEIAE